MPNWTFLTLHFFHTMALALWVGGGFAIGALVAPVAFREAGSRALASRIVGSALRRFDLVVLPCIVALVVTSLLMIRWYGRFSPWYAIEYACIAMMSGSAFFSAVVVTPRIRALQAQRQAESLTRAAAAVADVANAADVANVVDVADFTDLTDGTGTTGADSFTEEFNRYHRLSVSTMQFNLACGTVAILFS